VCFWNHNGCLWLYLHTLTHKTFHRFSRSLGCHYVITEQPNAEHLIPLNHKNVMAEGQTLEAEPTPSKTYFSAPKWTSLKKYATFVSAMCCTSYSNNSVTFKIYHGLSLLLWYVLNHYSSPSFAQQPPVGQGLLIHEASRSHTTRHHSR